MKKEYTTPAVTVTVMKSEAVIMVSGAMTIVSSTQESKSLGKLEVTF